MAGQTDYTAQKLLDWIVGKTDMPANGTAYIGLFTAVGADDGTGFTEVSTGSYGRVTTSSGDWNAASGSAPSSNSNANDLIFPTSTADWGTIIAWGIFDASTSGNLRAWDYLGNFDWLEFTCTLASPGVFTVPGHGYSNGDLVVVDAEFLGGTIPTTGGSFSGLLTVANVTTNTFTVGVNTTSVGSGAVRKVASQAVPSGSVFSFPASDFVLKAA